jgi:hypothetical protein
MAETTPFYQEKIKYNISMKDETVLLHKFKLDRFSPLVEDALLIQLDLKKYRQTSAPLFQATILGLFENKKELVIFFYVPVAGQYLSEVEINKARYGVQIQDEDGFVHKYIIPFPFKPGKLTVTEYVFIDDTLKKTTSVVNEEHVFGLLNGQYMYDSKKYHQTQLEGELLYDVVDMTTLQHKFQDLVGRSLTYRDVSSLKAKAIKLYYVAFNLFDHQQKRYFVPDDIVEMNVSYQESRYVYQAKKVINTQDVDPKLDGEKFPLDKKETIAKEPRKIESGEKSDWNIVQNFFSYKHYHYDSIYRLSDQIKLKQKQAANYTYVVVVGPKQGYRHSQVIFKRANGTDFDFEETTLSQIKVYHITYQERGHRYAVPVQSLVYETDKKSRLPRFKNRLIRFLKTVGKVLVTPIKFLFGASGFVIKLVTWIIRHWKLVLVMLVLLLLGYLGIQIAGIFQ